MPQNALPREGQTATNPQTSEKIIYSGGQWGPVNGSQHAPVFVPGVKDPVQQQFRQGQVEAQQRDAADAPLRRAALEAQVGNRQDQQQNYHVQQSSQIRDDYNNQPEVKAYAMSVPVYAAALESKPDPAGDLNLIYAYAKVMDPTSVVREGEQAAVAGGDTWANQTVANLKKQLTGSGTFAPEYRDSLIQEMRNRVMQQNRALSLQRDRYRAVAERNGLNADDVIGPYPGAAYEQVDRNYWTGKGFQIAGDAPVSGPPQVQGQPNGPVSGFVNALQNNQPAPPIAPPPIQGLNAGTGSEGAPEIATQKNYPYSNKQDMDLFGEGQSAFDQGASRQQMDAINAKYGRPAWGPELDSAIKARDAHIRQNFTPGRSGIYTQNIFQNLFNKTAATPIGGGVVATGTGLANGMTAGFLDEMTGGINSVINGTSASDEIAKANMKKNLLASAHPYANFVGEAAGSVLGTKGLGEIAQAARLGTLVAKVPAVVKDIAYGGAYGAGQSNENRAAGAALGAATGVAGHYTGNAVATVAKPILSPALRTLVDAGGKPTVGQILGTKGLAGKTFKRIEDITASLPLVGATTRNAQARATASVNTAQINRALRPLGETLPKDIAQQGHEAIDYAHNRLGQVYNETLPKLSGAPDKTFLKRIDLIRQRANIAPGSSGAKALDDAALELSRAFDPAKNGSFTGRSLKNSSERLGDLARGWQKADDPYLRIAGQAAEKFRDQLHSLARRQNPGEVAAKLRAADRGYASLVRTEKAALGSPDGTFSVSQLNSAVRQTDQSARRNAVARGKALDQDLSGAAASVMGDTAAHGGSKDVNALAALIALGTHAATGNPAALGVGGALGANALVYSKPAQDALRWLLTAPPSKLDDVVAAIGKQGGKIAAVSSQ